MSFFVCKKCRSVSKTGEKRIKRQKKYVGEVKYKTMAQQRTLRGLARQAKSRMKSGFWNECMEDLNAQMEKAKEQGLKRKQSGKIFQEPRLRFLVGGEGGRILS